MNKHYNLSLGKLPWVLKHSLKNVRPFQIISLFACKNIGSFSIILQEKTKAISIICHFGCEQLTHLTRKNSGFQFFILNVLTGRLFKKGSSESAILKITGPWLKHKSYAKCITLYLPVLPWITSCFQPHSYKTLHFNIYPQLSNFVFSNFLKMFPFYQR